jgi:dTDP-4-dehydrorhamnose reductase
MKILITGANGQLGTDLVKVLKEHQVTGLTHADIDITNYDDVKAACLQHKPEVIINTAAYIRVDDCETNQDLAFKVNALGARNMAVAAEGIGAKLVQISTDYVFGGERDKPSKITPLSLPLGRGEETNPSVSPLGKGRGDTDNPTISPLEKGRGNEPLLVSPWEGERKPYTEYDEAVPLNVYGKSKLAGEEYVRHLCRRYFVIRASGLFGVAGSSGKGGNFIETILRLAKERDKLTVVNDQVFSPTYTPDLALKISQLMRTELYGVYHITNSGSCSWYEFAREALRLTGSKTPILPITSAKYPQKAKRPSYSVMGHYNLKLQGMDDVRGWGEGLENYFIQRL